MRQKGFSLVELIIAAAILSIMAAIAIPNLTKYYRDYKFNDYASRMEYLVKYSKIYAMEKTKNVGLCVNTTDKSFTIRDLGTSRGADKCSGSKIREMSVSEGYITLAGYGVFGLGPTIDPRGLAIFNGSVCISNGTKYSRVCIKTASIRTEKGDGGCSSCSN
jgi:prepilin-type N-terminal cleavage/methylation domain-containing protein